MKELKIRGKKVMEEIKIKEGVRKKEMSNRNK
jgi:hypothetical protein